MSTVVRITSAPARGWSKIIVEANHAESCYKHFRTIGAIGITPLKDSPEAEVCVETDGEGRKRVVVVEDHKTFEVQAHPQSLAPILMHWINSFT